MSTVELKLELVGSPLLLFRVFEVGVDGVVGGYC